jgi:hypothetical protein
MTTFNYNPDDDGEPFMLPGELDKMRLEAKQKLGGRRPLSLQEEIQAALSKPFVPNITEQ